MRYNKIIKGLSKIEKKSYDKIANDIGMKTGNNIGTLLSLCKDMKISTFIKILKSLGYDLIVQKQNQIKRIQLQVTEEDTDEVIERPVYDPASWERMSKFERESYIRYENEMSRIRKSREQENAGIFNNSQPIKGERGIIYFTPEHNEGGNEYEKMVGANKIEEKKSELLEQFSRAIDAILGDGE